MGRATKGAVAGLFERVVLVSMPDDDHDCQPHDSFPNVRSIMTGTRYPKLR